VFTLKCEQTVFTQNLGSFADILCVIRV